MNKINAIAVLIVGIALSVSTTAFSINFFLGYLHMLQGEFEAAKESLNLVIKDYPQSSYANKAKLCLNRIENMTE